MTLGRFGAEGQKVKFRSGGGGAPGGLSLADVARELQSPSPEGNPAATQQIASDAITLRFNDTASDTMLNATYTDIITRTYTPAVAVDVLVIAGFTFQEKTSCIAGEGSLRVTFDGTQITGSLKYCYLTLIGVNTNFTTLMCMAIKTSVTAESHTFVMQGLAPVSGGGNQWSAVVNTMTILELKR